MKFIVATNNKGYIGKDGELMWRSSEDFKHFKKMTMGGILIVGATTYEKDLKGRELPGRELLVVGRNYLTLWEAVRRAAVIQERTPYTRNPINGCLNIQRHIWVIGGASIYDQLVQLATEIHISVINDDQEGDRKFELPAVHHAKVFTYKFEPNASK